MSQNVGVLSIDIFNETINDLTRLYDCIDGVNTSLIAKAQKKYAETITEEKNSFCLLSFAKTDENVKRLDKMAAAAGLPETAAWYSAAVVAYNEAVIHRKKMEYRLDLAKKCVHIANETLEKTKNDCYYYLNQIDNILKKNIIRLGGTDEDVRRYLARRSQAILGNEIKKNSPEDNKSETNPYDNIQLPRNNGSWSGEVGNSKWIPDPNYAPKLFNPEELIWEEILKPYNVKNIPFREGKPDFSKFAKSQEVKIDKFTSCRAKNFAAFDKKLADMEEKTAKEISEYRKKNGLTIHEKDKEGTMFLVASIIHGNIPHSGGISELKNMEG